MKLNRKKISKKNKRKLKKIKHNLNNQCKKKKVK